MFHGSALFLLLWLLGLMIGQGRANLICNGDFQNYNLTSNDTSSTNYPIKTSNFTSNSSCWFAKQVSGVSRLQFQVKQYKVGGILTQVLDFIAVQEYQICQNVTVQPSSLYQLGYHYIIDTPHTRATVNCLINNVSVNNVTANSSSVPVTTVLNYTALAAHAVICFNTTTVFKNSANIIDKGTYGSLLDNVSLILIPSPANTTNQSSTNTTPATNTTVPTNITNNTGNTTNNTTAPTTINTATNATASTESSSNTSFSLAPPPSLNYSTVPAPAPEIIYIDGHTFWNPSTGIMQLSTNCRLLDYGISLEFIRMCIVSLDDSIITKVVYGVDLQGYLFLKIYPDIVVTPDNLYRVKIYLPQEYWLLVTRDSKKFIFRINGDEVTYGMFTTNEKKFMAAVEPIAEQISKAFRDAFILMNIFYCSYFIFSLVEFWNLALLYNFLPISSVPKFTEGLFAKMITFFFSCNSVSKQIEKLASHDNFLEESISYGALNRDEKIMTIRGNRVWFGFVGSSSNFMANNLDSLILMGLFLAKFLVVFLGIKLLPKRFQTELMKQLQLYHHLSKQIICFLPLILVSALEVLLSMAETSALGKLNSSLHITLVSLIIMIFVSNLLKQPSRPRNKAALQQQISHAHAHCPKRDLIAQVLQIAMNILIPSLVVIRNTLGFFIIVSIVVLGKVKHYVSRVKRMKPIARVFGFLDTLVWLVFHITFIIFYLLQLLKAKGFTSPMLTKYLGFIAVGCVLIGGCFNILECLIKILHGVYKWFCPLDTPSPSLKASNPQKSLQEIQAQFIEQYNTKKKQTNESFISSHYCEQKCIVFVGVERVSKDRVKITAMQKKGKKKKKRQEKGAKFNIRLMV